MFSLVDHCFTVEDVFMGDEAGHWVFHGSSCRSISDTRFWLFTVDLLSLSACQSFQFFSWDINCDIVLFPFGLSVLGHVSLVLK